MRRKEFEKLLLDALDRTRQSAIGISMYGEAEKRVGQALSDLLIRNRDDRPLPVPDGWTLPPCF